MHMVVCLYPLWQSGVTAAHTVVASYLAHMGLGQCQMTLTSLGKVRKGRLALLGGREVVRDEEGVALGMRTQISCIHLGFALQLLAGTSPHNTDLRRRHCRYKSHKTMRSISQWHQLSSHKSTQHQLRRFINPVRR